jgi:hypothetical protein
MECSQARSLVPSYLDGELSQAQAAPLRRHLLDCQPCRAGAQGEKNLKRWFVASEVVEVPQDFAARVARRAFAGDTGDRFGEPMLAGGLAGGRSRSIRSGSRAGAEDDNLRFVLQITSIAALVLIVLSIALKSFNLPSGLDLEAQRPETSLEQAIEQADRLQRAESRSAIAPPAAPATRPAEARKP